MAIKPIGDKILVEVLEENENKVGSIFVPDTAKEKPQQAKIVAVGEGTRDGDKVIPPSVKVGEVVLFSKYSGTELSYEGKDYLILQESNILAVLSKK